MKRSGGSRFRFWRKRVRPLRPWLAGLKAPGIISELADVVPFIYFCCKLSVAEQSWATKPQDPKAVIAKGDKSFKLSDGQFWIDLTVDDSLKDLLVCGNRIRSRDVCFFIVFLNEYDITYNSDLECFVARVNGLRKVEETHCLEETFKSIPSIKSVELKLLTVIPSSSSGGSESHCFSKPQDIEIGSRLEHSGSDSKIGNEKLKLPQHVSLREEWIPTQNASEETLSFVSENNVSLTGDLNRSSSTHCVPPTPQKVALPSSDCPLFSPTYSPISASLSFIPESSLSLQKPEDNLLDRLQCPCVTKLSNNKSNFLFWLGLHKPTAAICCLEETARAIDKLHDISPADPFSDYFNNFAFSD